MRFGVWFSGMGVQSLRVKISVAPLITSYCVFYFFRFELVLVDFDVLVIIVSLNFLVRARLWAVLFC